LNPISKIVADVKWAIPIEILNVAFVKREFGQRVLPVNVDELIREKIIEGKVRPDCDLVGGTEIVVPLSDLRYEQWDQYRLCYQIPRERTGGRNITRCHSVIIGNQYFTGSAFSGLNDGTSQTLQAVQGVLASVTSIPIVATYDVQLVGPNMVLVSDVSMMNSQLQLRCYVENDADFNNLRSTAIQRFSEMCVLATKAYIYNTLKIPMDMGQLVGGMQLGAFKEIVDSYSDAAQLYQEFLLHKWKRIAILNDPMAKKRHVRILMGGHR